MKCTFPVAAKFLKFGKNISVQTVPRFGALCLTTHTTLGTYFSHFYPVHLNAHNKVKDKGDFKHKPGPKATKELRQAVNF